MVIHYVNSATNDFMGIMSFIITCLKRTTLVICAKGAFPSFALPVPCSKLLTLVPGFVNLLGPILEVMSILTCIQTWRLASIFILRVRLANS